MANLRGKRVLDSLNTESPELTGINSPIISQEAIISGQNIPLFNRDLRGFIFDDLIIRDVDFSYAKLQGASFERAKLVNVRFDNVKTGITKQASIYLRFLSYLLAFTSGIVGAYSSDYFLYIIADSIVFELATVWVPLCFVILLVISIVWSFINGLGRLFAGTLLVVVFLSFFIQAFSPESMAHLAASSVISLSCFVGVFTAFLTQSQATYLADLIDDINDSGFSKKPVMYVSAAIGVLFGLFTSATGELYSIAIPFLSAAWVVLGSRLAIRARREKKTLNQAVNREFIEYSDDQHILSFFRDDLSRRDRGFLIDGFSNLVKIFKDARDNRLKRNKYAAIRIIFDSLVENIETSFLDSEFVNVTFNNTRLDRTCFRPRKVEIKKTDRTTERESSDFISSCEKTIEAVERHGHNVVLFKVSGDFVAGENFSISSGEKIVKQKNTTVGNVSGVVNIDGTMENVNYEVHSLSELNSQVDIERLDSLLNELRDLLNSEPSSLTQEDREDALEQIEVIAETGRKPKNQSLRKSIRMAVKILKGTAASVKPATQFAVDVGKLVTEISQLLGLVGL
jgi:hypothetical protein